MRTAEYNSAEDKKFYFVYKTQSKNTEPKKENKGGGNSPLSISVRNPAQKHSNCKYGKGVRNKVNVKVLYVYGKRKDGDKVKRCYKCRSAYKQRS